MWSFFLLEFWCYLAFHCTWSADQEYHRMAWQQAVVAVVLNYVKHFLSDSFLLFLPPKNFFSVSILFELVSTLSCPRIYQLCPRIQWISFLFFVEWSLFVPILLSRNLTKSLKVRGSEWEPLKQIMMIHYVKMNKNFHLILEPSQ